MTAAASFVLKPPVFRPWAIAAGTGAIATGAVAAFGLASPALVSLAAQAAILALLALGVGLLNRVLGQISFGHAAPFGLAAYGTAVMLGGGAMPPELAIGLVVLAIFGLFFAVGLVVSRLEGIAFSMLTLAIGQGAFVAVTKFRGLTGGADGVILSLPRRLFGLDSAILQRPDGMVAVSVAVLAVVYTMLRLFELSRLGRLAVAIRENEERARFLGFRTRAMSAFVYGLSCLVAGCGGVLFSLYQGFVSPEILHWSFSGSALIMAILGGSTALWGPIGGACVYLLIRDSLSEVTHHWHFVLGVLLIAVTVAWPTGLAGAGQQLATWLRRRTGGVR